MQTLLNDICPGCGHVGLSEGETVHPYLTSSPACWEVFGDVLAREYQDIELMTAHHLSVDAYALQHPGHESSKTIQSAHIHLFSMYLYFDKNLPSQKLAAQLQTLSRTKNQDADVVINRGFVWMPPPQFRGEFTAAYLAGAGSNAQFISRRFEWASCVYKAWAEHHDKAASFYERLVADG